MRQGGHVHVHYAWMFVQVQTERQPGRAHQKPLETVHDAAGPQDRIRQVGVHLRIKLLVILHIRNETFSINLDYFTLSTYM